MGRIPCLTENPLCRNILLCRISDYLYSLLADSIHVIQFLVRSPNQIANGFESAILKQPVQNARCQVEPLDRVRKQLRVERLMLKLSATGSTKAIFRMNSSPTLDTRQAF